MQNIPNLITSVRLICALMIILLSFLSPDHGTQWFLTLFIAAAVSDMLDGFIARRFNWCTTFGATLDSISDLTLYFAVTTFLFFVTPQALLQSAGFFVTGAAVQIFHIAYALKRFSKYPAYHTDFSRVCAYLIFFAVLGFWSLRIVEAFKFVATLWTLCSLEGIAITYILDGPEQDLRGITEAVRIKQKKGQNA